MRDTYTATVAGVGILEVRRHADRKTNGGSQLSQEGVDRARRLGASMGPYVKVVTSVLPRARETALAMGFAVDHELVTMTNEPELHADAARLEAGTFTALAEALRTPGPFHEYAHAMAGVWRDLMTPIGNAPDAVLFIGHSGEIEAALLACFPEADHGSWGEFFGPCQGARLTFAGEPYSFWRDVQLLRND